VTLTVPITALLAVHSAGEAGVIIGGMSLAQKIEALRLLVSAGRDAARIHQQLAPIRAMLVAKIRADLAKPYQGQVVAVVHGGPNVWGQPPVTFVYLWGISR
jgi:hypothetical protein